MSSGETRRSPGARTADRSRIGGGGGVLAPRERRSRHAGRRRPIDPISAPRRLLISRRARLVKERRRASGPSDRSRWDVPTRAVRYRR